MNRNKLERRNLTFEVRAEDQDGGHILTGRPVVYNSRTDIGPFDEIIEPGALDRTDLTDVRFLVNHNLSMIPLARSRRNNGNSTMQLSVDAQGLSLDRADLDIENNADARALYSAVQRGDITGRSMWCSGTDGEWEGLETEHPTRRIKEIGSIVEISAVIFPAYDATEINARGKDALESAQATLESERQKRGVEVETSTELELEKAKLEMRRLRA